MFSQRTVSSQFVMKKITTMASTPHALKVTKPTNLKQFNYEASHRACHDWLSGEFSQSNYLQLYSRKCTGCGCMRFLANLTVPGVLDAVAVYMIQWASLPLEMKYEVLHEWMKVADFIEITFPDPEIRS